MGDKDVLVRVEAAGICGSDIHGMDGSSGRRIPPLIMGHEAAGVIEAVGASVAGWQIGDAVTFDSTVYCGRCRFCAAGDRSTCATAAACLASRSPSAAAMARLRSGSPCRAGSCTACPQASRW